MGVGGHGWWYHGQQGVSVGSGTKRAGGTHQMVQFTLLLPLLVTAMPLSFAGCDEIVTRSMTGRQDGVGRWHGDGVRCGRMAAYMGGMETAEGRSVGAGGM